MNIDQRIRKRTRELIARGEAIGAAPLPAQDAAGNRLHFECRGWIASAQNILSKVYPNERSAHQQAAKAALGAGHVVLQVGHMTAVLKSMLFDIDAGVIASTADAARAETFDELLDEALLCLRSGHTPQAAVMAGIVFESVVRRTCIKNGLETKGIALDALIATLSQTGLLTELSAKRARAAAEVRALSTQAQWAKADPFDVQATIATARDLIDRQLAI